MKSMKQIAMIVLWRNMKQPHWRLAQALHCSTLDRMQSLVVLWAWSWF